MNASTDSKITRKDIKTATGLLVILWRMLMSDLQCFFTHLCCICSSYPCSQGNPPVPHNPIMCSSALLSAQCSRSDSFPCVETRKSAQVCSGSPLISNVAEGLLHPCFVTPPSWKKSAVLSLLTKGEILHLKNSFLSMTIWRCTKSKACLIPVVTHLNRHHYGAETISGLCISGIYNIELHYNEIHINASLIKCFSYSVGIQKSKMPIILF